MTSAGREKQEPEPVRLFVYKMQRGYRVEPPHAIARRDGTLVFTNLTRRPVKVSFARRFFEPADFELGNPPGGDVRVHIVKEPPPGFYGYRAMVLEDDLDLEVEGGSSPGVIIQP